MNRDCTAITINYCYHYTLLISLYITTMVNHHLVNIFPTKITVAQNGVALSHHKVRGLYFLAVDLVATVVYLRVRYSKRKNRK